MNFFPKKTKEEKMAFRVNAVLSQLTSESDFTFTDLETMQNLNEVNRLYIEFLKSKYSDCIEKSNQFDQKAKEIQSVIDLMK